MLRSILLSLLAAGSLLVRAQAPATVPDKPFDKDHFSDEQGLRTALAALKQGDAAFRQGGMSFSVAIAAYDRAYAFNPDNLDLNLKLGLCHLNGPQREQALPFFRKVLAIDPETPRIHFYLAYSYQLNAQWDEAIAEFQTQRSITTVTPDPDRMYNMADKHIAECKYGKGLMAKPTGAEVKPLGDGINSTEADYGVLVSADGKQLFFTSRRSTGTGGKVNKTTNEYFEDVYACTATATGWSLPAPLTAPLNSPLNDASVGVFDGGQKLLIYRDAKGAGDIFESVCTNGTWSEPKPFGPNVNSTANETSAWFSADRHWLYFVSDREGGLGGQDIWRSAWVEATKDWGPAENLGPVVNTMYDEDGVFVPGDGNTIYFSSRGLSSMGGYDVFKSTCTKGTWSRPENLGWPINSPDDDQFFTLSADGRTGYLSSSRSGGLGDDDIYRVDLAPRPKVDETALLASAGNGLPTVDPAEQQQLTLKGFVKNLKPMPGSDTYVRLMDLHDTSFTAQVAADPATGAFTATVPKGHDYALVVRAGDRLIHTEHISAEAAGAPLDIALQPIESGHQEVLRNVFFAKDKSELDPTSRVELEQLVTWLRDNPALRVEVSGHTDDQVGAVDNQELSTARAKAVVDLLVSRGIAAERLEAKGYAGTRPLVPNDTEEHRAMNRRTEIRVL